MSDETTVREAAALVDLPDGAIPEYGLTIVSFLDPDDGETYYGFRVHGNPPLSSIVGMCVLAQRKLIDDYYDDEEEG